MTSNAPSPLPQWERFFLPEILAFRGLLVGVMHYEYTTNLFGDATMASKLVRAVPSVIKPLADALSDGHRYPPGEMFRFFLGSVMEVWGYQPWYPVPADAQPLVQQAIGCYDQALSKEEPFKDILGILYEELASHGGKQLLGQFFTPWSIASMMARMNADPDHQTAGNGLKAFSDPACGSGVMLLAKANQLLEANGPDELRNWQFHGCDIDGICARMTAIQLAANCAVHRLEIGEIIIQQGNTLSLSETKTMIMYATAPPKVALAS